MGLPRKAANLTYTFRSIKPYTSDARLSQADLKHTGTRALCQTAKQPLLTVPISDARVHLYTNLHSITPLP